MNPGIRTAGNSGNRLKDYWKLIKSLQTGLLLLTGLAGFMSSRCPLTTWHTLLGVSGSLFLAISGSTILNMVHDRDIDAMMERTAGRPLPAGLVPPAEAFLVGLAMTAAGIAWALYLDPLYCSIVLAGAALDVLLYTVWLKRRTPWAILWGGVSGGMPILAGRALAEGGIDLTGVLLTLAVLLWIPTHIMTFGIRYNPEYRRAGVPVFANTHGEDWTRVVIGLSTIAAAASMILAAHQLEMVIGFWRAQLILASLLLLLTLASVLRPSAKLNSGLFKAASIYMLGSMGLIIFGA